jgi:1,4-dihydroxy-2-naphthoate octaprenyltransferase
MGIFVAFGVLPVAGSYFVQAGSIDWRVLVASIPPGMFTVSVLYNHHFSHASADASSGKMSPVVVLGESRARKLSPVLLTVGYLVIVANALLGIYPLASLASLVTAPFIFRSYAKLTVPSTCEASLGFLMNVIKANAATGAVLIGALVLSMVL